MLTHILQLQKQLADKENQIVIRDAQIAYLSDQVRVAMAVCGFHVCVCVYVSGDCATAAYCAIHGGTRVAFEAVCCFNLSFFL
jgi:hypothetical protein